MKLSTYGQMKEAQAWLDGAIECSDEALTMMDLIGDHECFQAVHSAITNLKWARKHMTQDRIEGL